MKPILSKSWSLLFFWALRAILGPGGPQSGLRAHRALQARGAQNIEGRDQNLKETGLVSLSYVMTRFARLAPGGGVKRGPQRRAASGS